MYCSACVEVFTHIIRERTVYWYRVFTEMGHTVRLMAPQFVKPFVKSNKNDAADAEAICEAVQRPSMRFVTPKSIEQQDIQCIIVFVVKRSKCKQCK